MTQIEPVAGAGLGLLAASGLPVACWGAGTPPVVRAANAAFVAAFGAGAGSAPTERVAALVAEAAATGAAVRRRVAAGATTWLVLADPSAEAGGALPEVVVTAVDLQDLQDPGAPGVEDVAALAAGHLDVGSVLRRGVERAAAVTGARRAVLYADTGDGTLRRVEATGGGDAPAELPAAAVAPPQGSAAVVGWSPEAGRPPLPFLGPAGWEPALVAEVPREGGRAVLVVADPGAGAFAPWERDRLALLTALLATGWRNAELRAERAELAALLRGGLETSAGLVDAATPPAVRGRLLRGVVEEMGCDAAVLWAPQVDGDGWELVAEVGLPPAVRRDLTLLAGPETAPAVTRQPFAGQAIVAPSTSWPGRDVRLLELPRPADGLLGVYTSRALPPLVDQILVTLTHALASAAHLAALHVRSRTVVDALQRELRPRDVRLPGGIETGWRYESATAGVEVGGDFFDVFTTEAGSVGVVCGDVSGKGVEAASLTAMAVHALRAYARDGAPPDEVVALLNGMACDRTAEERFLTLAYVLLDPAADRAQLTLAGHPPPVRVGRGGVALLDVEADLPVGVLEDAAYASTAVRLAPGEALVLYTDGVTEARGHADGELLGTEGLVRILAAAGERDAAGLAEAVWAGVQAHTAGNTSDDCAILVLRRLGD